MTLAQAPDQDSLPKGSFNDFPAFRPVITVRAARINSRSEPYAAPDDESGYRVRLGLGEGVDFASKEVGSDFINEFDPQVGGYYVECISVDQEPWYMSEEDFKRGFAQLPTDLSLDASLLDGEKYELTSTGLSRAEKNSPIQSAGAALRAANGDGDVPLN